MTRILTTECLWRCVMCVFIFLVKMPTKTLSISSWNETRLKRLTQKLCKNVNFFFFVIVAATVGVSSFFATITQWVCCVPCAVCIAISLIYIIDFVVCFMHFGVHRLTHRHTHIWILRCFCHHRWALNVKFIRNCARSQRTSVWACDVCIETHFQNSTIFGRLRNRFNASANIVYRYTLNRCTRVSTQTQTMSTLTRSLHSIHRSSLLSSSMCACEMCMDNTDSQTLLKIL